MLREAMELGELKPGADIDAAFRVVTEGIRA